MRAPPLAPRHVAALLAALQLALGLPLLGQAGGTGPDDVDERLFHLPTVLRFAEQLPLPDLRDYPSATGPLHHLGLALLARGLGPELGLLRLGNLLVAVAGVALVGAFLARRTAPRTALLLALPLLASPYWLGPAVRISTDDAALVWVAVSLGAAWADARDPRPGTWALAVGAGVAAVWTRQLHLWLALPLALGALRPALLGGVGGPSMPRLLSVGLLPLGFAPLALAWGGLVPPSVARAHQSLGNPAAVQLALAVLGLLGPFYLPWWREELRDRGPRRAAALAAALAAASLLCWPLPWALDPNRIGGAVWALAGRGPQLFGSAALLLLLVPLGAALAVLLAWAEGRRGSWLVAMALPAWLLANAANERAYHKYYEPFLLLLLAWVAARAPAGPARWLWGPGLLALAYLGVDALRFAG